MNIDWDQQASEMFKGWSDGQKAWLETLGRGPAGPFSRPAAGAKTATKPGVDKSFASAEGLREGARQLNDAWKASVEQWQMLLHHGKSLVGNQGHLRKLFDAAVGAEPAPVIFDSAV